MARASLRARAFARTPDPEQFNVDYDVVVVQDDGRELVVASTEKATIRVEAELSAEVGRLLMKLGLRMEKAVGLGDELDSADEQETKEEEEL